MPLILQGRRCRYCVTYTCHSLICFSTCCRALDTTPTVPPLPDTVYLILSRKSTLLNCVTYTWLSSCKKRPGQYRKKFNILPASAASQALQNPVSLHRTRQSKKKSDKSASRSQKTKSKRKKNNGIAALSTIINCFCRQNVTEKLENSGKNFKRRGDRREAGEERAGRVLVGRQTVRLWWFYIILWLWNLIPKVFL